MLRCWGVRWDRGLISPHLPHCMNVWTHGPNYVSGTVVVPHKCLPNDHLEVFPKACLHGTVLQPPQSCLHILWVILKPSPLPLQLLLSVLIFHKRVSTKVVTLPVAGARATSGRAFSLVPGRGGSSS